MRSYENVQSIDCARAMDRIHRRLDGDLLDREATAWLERHLASCEACRRADHDLRRIQSALRGLAGEELPEAGLDRVWRETTRAPAAPLRSTRWRVAAAVAAAVLVAASLGLWFVGDPRTAHPDRTAAIASPTEEDLETAGKEARFVLQFTSRALRRTERAAVDRVLEQRVSPAIGKIPIRWSEVPAGSTERRPDGDRNG